ncbi:MAG: TonB-dependent receptor [Ignavibacteriaceae bacterium]|nr:TonB-dependent receptor [Ignavibacteriaceae bacterium]
MMNKRYYLISYLKSLIYIPLFLLLAGQLSAQTSGKLSGRVLDNEGNPLVGANVIIDGTNQGAATDFEGYYSIINIRAGTYTVKYRYIGYQSKTVESVRISADKTTTIDMVLEFETIKGEEVVVTAKKPIVEFNETSSVVSVNKDEIDVLPVQSLNEIVNLQAGVIDGHFRGGRLGEVQYQVDGVTVNNPFNNASSLELDKSVIEEVQVISGTFDAKYGQAMSGVVNAVLRSGSDKFEFSGEVFSGGNFSTDTERYPNADKIRPVQIQNYQITVLGPTPLPSTTFFLSGRHYRNNGYLYGERRFLPTDQSDFEKKIFNASGDNELVAMALTREWSGQGKITNRSFSGLELAYQATLNLVERTPYIHSFRFNPDGVKSNNTISVSHGFSVTHSLSDKMFYKINGRQNYFEYTDYKYEDLYDPRYLAAGEPKGDANYEDGAIVQGVDLGRYKQSTNSVILKGDFTWQADRIHLLEAGAEFNYSDILFGSPGFLVSTNVNGVQVLQPRENIPRVPGVQSYYPLQFAAYAQDRIELGDLVVRGGLRLELFDARSTIPSDLANPANSIQGAPVSVPKATSVKWALAPRLGFSFPLTVSSSVYFSYGHFFQLPGLGLLYGNADYSLLDQLQAGGISYGVMGNPDLKPEFTVQYETGYKQAIGNSLGVELSFFYKDIKDLLGVEFVSTYTAAEYGRFTNVDFGSVYGFTLSLSQRNWGNLSTSVDYTLQFAEGNSSDPRETANRAASGQDARPRTISFGWDQRSTLNASIIYAVPGDFTVSSIIRFGSGQPYTPEIGSGFNARLETNTGRKDSYVLVDLRAEKFFDAGPVNLSLFARVSNLFNNHYVNGFVFSSTGSPDYSLNPSSVRSVLNDPSRFYEPRRIEIGISFRSK